MKFNFDPEWFKRMTEDDEGEGEIFIPYTPYPFEDTKEVGEDEGEIGVGIGMPFPDTEEVGEDAE
jgi:hypothetical protein